MTMATRSTVEVIWPLVLVAMGGFAGATARYGVELALPTVFPWGTLAVNVVGSFVLGILFYEAQLLGRLSPKMRLLAGTGFLSSFTTYSTFAVETVSLSPRVAVLNVAANYGLGLLAVVAGRALVWRWAR